jgi:hypothetical protein
MRDAAASRPPLGYDERGTPPVSALQCGWTNTSDIGIPTSAAGPRAPDPGKGKSVVREPTWSPGSAQDSATGVGATFRRLR